MKIAINIVSTRAQLPRFHALVHWIYQQFVGFIRILLLKRQIPITFEGLVKDTTAANTLLKLLQTVNLRYDITVWSSTGIMFACLYHKHADKLYNRESIYGCDAEFWFVVVSGILHVFKKFSYVEFAFSIIISSWPMLSSSS